MDLGLCFSKPDMISSLEQREEPWMAKRKLTRGPCPGEHEGLWWGSHCWSHLSNLRHVGSSAGSSWALGLEGKFSPLENGLPKFLPKVAPLPQNVTSFLYSESIFPQLPLRPFDIQTYIIISFHSKTFVWLWCCFYYLISFWWNDCLVCGLFKTSSSWVSA